MYYTLIYGIAHVLYMSQTTAQSLKENKSVAMMNLALTDSMMNQDSRTITKMFGTEPHPMNNTNDSLKNHSALCEKATHKDCTCPCNGKYHGISSVQSKLVIFS